MDINEFSILHGDCHIDDDGNNILHIVCYRGSLKSLNMLMNMTNIHKYMTTNKMGESPFDILVKRGDVELIALLLSKIPLTNDIFYKICDQGSSEMLKLVIDRGLPEDIVYYVLRKCSYEIIDLVLSSGVKINSPDEFGQSPFHILCSRRDLKLFKSFVSKLNKRYLESCVKNYLKPDNFGMTPFHLSSNDFEILKLLVELAKENKCLELCYLVNINGWTPLDFTRYNKNRECYKLLSSVTFED